MKKIISNVIDFLNNYIAFPNFGLIDVIEILIIAFVIYHILVWIKNSRAWTLLKGILVILAFGIVAVLFNMSTILWIANKTLSVGVIAAIVIFQPELRRALEQIGRREFLNNFFDVKNVEKFSDENINEITRAAYEMGKHKTGALIVIENEVKLGEYERTGIYLDAEISSQLLINIFEHNTPLHDGAVIIKGDRICSATCYLPLSDNMEISKELGTRHRAAVGVSEVTDSLTIIVSEETGKVSIAIAGNLTEDIDSETLKEELRKIQNRQPKKKFILWKEKKNDKEAVNE